MNNGSGENPHGSVPSQYVVSQPLLSAPASKSLPVHKGLIISAMALLIVLVVLVAGLVLALVASKGEVLAAKATADAAIERAESSESPAPEAPTPPSPEPEEEAPVGKDVYGLGDTFTVGAVTLTIHSIEPVDIVEVTEGEPFIPDTGGQLFLMKSTYSNSKNQADLSCGSGDLFLQMVDSEEREMAQLFDSYRIPGNPGCNEQLLQDTPREWSLVFQGVADASPLGVVVNETITWPEPAVVRFQ